MGVGRIGEDSDRASKGQAAGVYRAGFRVRSKARKMSQGWDEGNGEEGWF